MPTLANIGYLQFAMLAIASPQVYGATEEVLSVSGVGFKTGFKDVTNFDSAAGFREFIADLKEGNEVTVVCNHRLSSNTNQLAFKAAQEAGVNRTFRLTYTGASPNLKITFTASPTGFEYLPSTTDQNQLQYSLKISGSIT